jgi:MATE family multidrug resistance protein
MTDSQIPLKSSLTEPGAEIGLGAGADTPREPTLEQIQAHPLREMLAIAAPTVVTMTSYTVMQFIDALMVKSIGPEPVYVAAQGNGGILAWLVMAAVLGLTGVVNSYVSQNLGAGRPREGAAYAWNALWLSAASWILVMLPFALLTPTLYGLMGHEPDLLRFETQYAQIMLAGGLFTTAARSLGHYFYGMHRPMIVMVSVLAGNLVNVAANYVLIFGHFGAPQLGVAGAAVGTVIGSFVELVIPFVIFVGPRYARELGTRAAWRPSRLHLRDICRIGWPGALMFVNEMICWAYLMTWLIPMAAEAAGDDPLVANTAGWIALRYMHLSFMPAVGLSIALTAIVGKCMGMRRPDLARSRTWLGVRVGMAYMALCAVAFLLFRDPLIGLFISAETPPDQRAALIAVGSKVMIAAAIFQLFDALAITLSGALRGAGDTVWPGVATLVLSWVCIVGGGHLTIALAPSLGGVGPWAGASAYIIGLGLALLVRFLQGHWTRMRLVRDLPDPASEAA